MCHIHHSLKEMVFLLMMQSFFLIRSLNDCVLLQQNIESNVILLYELHLGDGF